MLALVSREGEGLATGAPGSHCLPDLPRRLVEWERWNLQLPLAWYPLRRLSLRAFVSRRRSRPGFVAKVSRLHALLDARPSEALPNARGQHLFRARQSLPCRPDLRLTIFPGLPFSAALRAGRSRPVRLFPAVVVVLTLVFPAVVVVLTLVFPAVVVVLTLVFPAVVVVLTLVAPEGEWEGVAAGAPGSHQLP